MLKDKKFFIRDYNLFDVTISPNGQGLCNFSSQYDEEKDKFINECRTAERDQLRRGELERNRLAEEAKAKEERANLWGEILKTAQTQTTSTTAPQLSRQTPKPSLVNESVIAKAEREFESTLASIPNRSSEFRDHEVISKWIDQLHNIKAILENMKVDDSYSQMVIDCERIIMGYYNNRYIALQNALRLEMKLKHLGGLSKEIK